MEVKIGAARRIIRYWPVFLIWQLATELQIMPARQLEILVGIKLCSFIRLRFDGQFAVPFVSQALPLIVRRPYFSCVLRTEITCVMGEKM